MDRPDTRKLWNVYAPGWTELTRAGLDVYRDLVNTPAFFTALPEVTGLLCLDLGCGEGHNTRLLTDCGARVVGLDIADLFVAAAAERARPGLRYVVGDGMVLPFQASSFDAVTAFMSVMDVADPEQALREVTRVLRPGGFVQFSVLHPVTLAPVSRWVHSESGEREAVAVGGYFYQGPFTQTFGFDVPEAIRDRYPPFTITQARRTIAGWISAVLDAGLRIEEVAEPLADEQTAIEHPAVADTRTVPYFLLIRARKP